MNRTTIGLSALLAVGAAGGVAAQTTVPAAVRPRSCARADSLAGHPLERPKESAYGWMQDGLAAIVSGSPMEPTATAPLESVSITANYRGDSVPSYGVQIRMKDSVLRGGMDAQITFILPDSTELPAGIGEAESTPESRRGAWDEIITAPLESEFVTRMINASSLRGRVGTTLFTVPPKTLERFRSAFIMATCHVGVR